MEIASAADTTVVLVVPGMGDSVQAAKAGVLEVADVLVVNKADRPGTREAHRDLYQMLDLSGDLEWRPPIVETVARAGQGIEELWLEIARHRRYLGEAGRLQARRAARVELVLRRVLESRLLAQIASAANGARYADVLAAVVNGELDPYRAAELLLGTDPPPSARRLGA